MAVISKEAVKRRTYWVDEIKKLSGNFSDDYDRLEKELTLEVKKGGSQVLIDHLRLCGNIPEKYGRDSSEEKLYSKYTDCLLSLSYEMIGLKSIVLTERADAADVDAYAKDFSFVADAKAFRLSRTAKNQKDFKVQAMNGWRRDKDYAMVVCPIYQLPKLRSQIYNQATTLNVCIFTYSHLALLLSFTEKEGEKKGEKLLKAVFETVQALNPSKNATDYWLGVNKSILSFSKEIDKLWKTEKIAALESIKIAKEQDLMFLAEQRTKIMKMSHKEALKELIKINKIEEKINIIKSITDNGLFDIQ